MTDINHPRPAFGIRSLVLMGLLTALEIVLSRFLSFAAWNMKIGFAFVPVVVAAMALGPLPAGIVAGVADFVGALLFPIGAYFPGFTLTAFLIGAVDGLLLRRGQSLAGVFLCVGINQLLLSLLLNTLWISMLYGSPYATLLATRLAQCAIMIPVQVLVIGVMQRTLRPYLKKEWRRAV